jgi:hypothetical protein
LWPGTGPSIPSLSEGPRPQQEINPAQVFDLEVPLAGVAEGYRGMDERRAIKTLLRV